MKVYDVGRYTIVLEHDGHKFYTDIRHYNRVRVTP